MSTENERSRSLWTEIPVPAYDALSGGLETDVLVIGTGIAGMSVAHELTVSGRQVVLIDRGVPTRGQTSRTTAHLSYACDDFYAELIKALGQSKAQAFYESQSAAVDRIEAIVRQEALDCDFTRLDGYFFPVRPEDADYLRDELEACHKIGFTSVSWQDRGGLPWAPDCPALRFPRQARFHPLKYLTALLKSLRQRGVRVIGDTPVTGLTEEDNTITAVTPSGIIKAKQVVVATNTPFHLQISMHTKQAPYRTYAVALAIPKGSVPDALYWDTEEPGYHYVRLQPDQDHDILIVGGEDHKSGEADDGEDRLDALEHWARERWPDIGVRLTGWSGQVYEPADYVPYIGRSPGYKEVYLVTGDSGQGMTTGVVSGLILRDLMNGQENLWSALYDPMRKPLSPSTIGEYVSENVTMVKGIAEHVLPSKRTSDHDHKGGDIKNIDAIGPGEGSLCTHNGEKVAAYRDQAGVLYLHSAVCSHAGCIVHWNPFEKCWDCPCHGSQFGVDGKVLNGPAIHPLPVVER